MTIFDHPRLASLPCSLSPIAPPPQVQASYEASQAFVDQSARDAARLLDADLYTGPRNSRVCYNSRACYRIANSHGSALLKISTGRNFHQVIHEVTLGRWAYEQGLAPRQTILAAPLGHVQVHEWIDAAPFSPTAAQLQAVMVGLRKFHAAPHLPGLVPKAPRLTEGARHHVDTYANLARKAPISAAQAQRRIEIIDRTHDLFSSNFAMCHGDATGANVCIVDAPSIAAGPGERVHLVGQRKQKVAIFIDFEDAGLSIPLHDVGKFLGIELVPKRQVDHLLRLYLDRPATFSERRYVRMVMAAIHLECFGYLAKDLADPTDTAKLLGFGEALLHDKDLFSWRYRLSGRVMTAVHASHFHLCRWMQRKTPDLRECYAP